MIILASCCHSENRYLLFLTENYAALEILHHYLHDMEGPTTTPTDASWEEEGRIKEMDPFILFGSSFPKDKEYTQVTLTFVLAINCKLTS